MKQIASFVKYVYHDMWSLVITGISFFCLMRTVFRGVTMNDGFDVVAVVDDT